MAGTTCGIPVWLEAGLTVFFTWLSSIICILIEHENAYCLAWAMQTLIVSGIEFVISVILHIIFSVIGIAWVGVFFWLVFFITWLFFLIMAIIKASSEDFFEMPLIGGYCKSFGENHASGSA